MLQLTINNQNDIKTQYHRSIENRIKEVMSAYSLAQIKGGYWKGKGIPVFNIIEA